MEGVGGDGVGVGGGGGLTEREDHTSCVSTLKVVKE